MISDEVRRAAIRALGWVRFDPGGGPYRGELQFSVGEYFNGSELDQIIEAVAGAVLAPVLALHQPCHGDVRMPGPQCSHPRAADARCLGCSEPSPCPTARAAGVEGSTSCPA